MQCIVCDEFACRFEQSYSINSGIRRLDARRETNACLVVRFSYGTLNSPLVVLIYVNKWDSFVEISKDT